MRRSGVSGLCHRPDEAVASNRAARRSPVDRLVFLTATCPSLHLLRTDAGPGRGAQLSTNPATVSRTYGDMSHFYIQMLSLSHRRRRYEIGERCGGAPVMWARDGSWARSRRGGRLRGSGGGRVWSSARSSLNPRARTSSRRARGSRYVLAGYPTISWARPGAGPAGMGREPESGPQRPWGGAADFGTGRAQVCMAAHTPRFAAPARGSRGRLA